MALTNITVEPLDRRHDRTVFHCGEEALDRYLKQQARQDADKRVAAPFVAVSPPSARVLGYYTLSASVLTLADLPDDLAVDQSTKGQGLGEHLLLDALCRSLTHADQIAAMAVVVDAKDEAAAGFYRHYGFLTLQTQPSRLFVPMGTVARLLGR